jgi:predicted AAA+ superfamily ATPase
MRMVKRPFWINKIHHAWETRSIIWLSGVRRVGKTTLAKMFSDAIYLNCDLPSVVRRLEDPETFYSSLKQNSVVIFDEIHRTADPSRLLKIAADEFGGLRILATGSSTLQATQKFKDALTGRKHTIYLPPILWMECTELFRITDLDQRLMQGGLPEPLQMTHKDVSFFSEWADSFYARDIQELFSIRNRLGFMKLLHFLMRQSGGHVDYTNLAKLCDLSRITIKAHIEAMSVAHAVFLLPPYAGGGRRELTQRHKCYAFDTGFVSFFKGWDQIREDDRGLLWEHITLDVLRAFYSPSDLFYWNDKSGREIDFILKISSDEIHTIECKINPDQFNSKTLMIFRGYYPGGKNYVISPNIPAPYQRSYGDLRVEYCSLHNCPLFSNYKK